MPMDQIILDFKEGRKAFKKTRIAMTVTTDRLDNMINAIGESSFMFKMLNKSEQIDFLLFYAEKSMINSPHIDITPISEKN